MPEKDGFELAKEIRAVCQKTPIFAVSTNYLYLRMIWILGATRAFCKSTDISKIVKIIKLSLPL
jgi:DNA-binding NarL/FixJ family response regulator